MKMMESKMFECDVTEEDVTALIYRSHHVANSKSLLAEPSMASLILRSMSEPQKLILLKMLNMGFVPVAESHISYFLATHRGNDVAKPILDELVSRSLIEGTQDEKTNQIVYRLNVQFYKGLNSAISDVTKRDKIGFLMSDAEAKTAPRISIYHCHVNAFRSWSNFIRWATDNVVKICVHKADPYGKVILEYSSINMYTDDIWKSIEITEPPPLLRQAVKPLFQKRPDDTTPFSKWLFLPPARQLSILVALIIKTSCVVNNNSNSGVTLEKFLHCFVVLSHFKIGTLCDLNAQSFLDPQEFTGLFQCLVYLGMFYTTTVEGGKLGFVVTPLMKLALASADDVDILSAPLTSPHLTRELFNKLVLFSLETICVDEFVSFPLRDNQLNELNMDPDVRSILQQAYLLASTGVEGIIVETNFKIFVYTDRNLIIGLVSQFAQLKILTQNLCCAILNRKSVHHAYGLGLDHQQLITFLELNAHPSIKDNGNVVPGNVKVQLKMWENERKRLEQTEVVLFEFNREEDVDYFVPVVLFCQRNNIVVASSALPTNHSRDSEEYIQWRSRVFAEMRYRARHGDSVTAVNALNYNLLHPGQLTAHPCLAIPESQKDLVKTYLTNLKNKA